MTTSGRRVAAAAIGSVAVLGGLIGAKALSARPTETTPTTGQTAADPISPVPSPSLDPHPNPTSSPGRDTAAAPTSAPPSAAAPASSPAGAASPTSGARDGTYTGQAAATRYGDVQVQIDVTSGRIDDIRVVAYPSQDRRSAQINQQAIPLLVAEGLAAQSAAVDTVSGATYTSEGYRRSLQSAIDQAGL